MRARGGGRRDASMDHAIPPKEGLSEAKAKLNAVNQLEALAAGELHILGPKSAYVPLRSAPCRDRRA